MHQYNYQQTPPVQPPIIAVGRRTKNKFLTFITALVPGAGQMYHGLLKKGLSIMILFWGIIAISVLLYIPVICFSLPVIWFYSFFDAVNRMNVSIDELAMMKDEYLYPLNTAKGEKFKNEFKKRHIWIGAGFIVVGIYAVLRMLLERFYMYFDSYLSDIVFTITRGVVNIIPALIVPILCIVIGVKLIKSSEIIKHRETFEQDDFKSEQL